MKKPNSKHLQRLQELLASHRDNAIAWAIAVENSANYGPEYCAIERDRHIAYVEALQTTLNFFDVPDLPTDFIATLKEMVSYTAQRNPGNVLHRRHPDICQHCLETPEKCARVCQVPATQQSPLFYTDPLPDDCTHYTEIFDAEVMKANNQK